MFEIREMSYSTVTWQFSGIKKGDLVPSIYYQCAYNLQYRRNWPHCCLETDQLIFRLLKNLEFYKMFISCKCWQPINAFGKWCSFIQILK